MPNKYNKRDSIFDLVKRLTPTVPNDDDYSEASIDKKILELESVHLQIAKTLSFIHTDVAECNSIISNKFIPLLLKFKKNSVGINNSTRFLKNLFENSLDVNIQAQNKDNSAEASDSGGSSSRNAHNKGSDRTRLFEETADLPESGSFSVQELAKKVNIGDSEGMLSESILSNDSNEHIKIDINQLLQNFKAGQRKLLGNKGKQRLGQSPEPPQNDDTSGNDANNKSPHQLGNTPTGKREINNLFANRSKVSAAENSSAIDFLNANSIIEQNTSTMTFENELIKDNKLDADTKTANETDSLPTAPAFSSSFKIQLSPRKRQKVNSKRSPSRFQTPKKSKNRKSSTIIEQLNLDDSPDDIPKTPELTYLKFSPIKLKKSKHVHGREKMTPTLSKGYNFGGSKEINDKREIELTGQQQHQASFASVSSSALDIPQLPSSLNFDDSNNTGTATYQTPNQLFFNSSSLSAGFHFRSPPASLKFALPKLNVHLTRSPVKELARRYTNDYLDMEVDDDSSLNSFELKNKKYNISNNTSTIDENSIVGKVASHLKEKVAEKEDSEDKEIKDGED